MESHKVVFMFIITVVIALIGGAIYQKYSEPNCTYSYDLDAKIIVANCPIKDAGLYDEIIIRSGSVYIHQAERIADLKLTLVKSSANKYVYKFEIVGNYAPDAWVAVDFSR